MKNLKDNKILKVLMLFVRIVFVFLFIAFVLMVCLQRFSGNRVSFFKYRMFTVATGSMSPQYVVGDVLVAKETKPEDIKVGDVVSYLGTKGSFKDKVITHKVVSIEKQLNGRYLFHTKGLTNVVEDPVVSEEQVYGVVKRKLYTLSFVYKIVGTTLGLFICVILPLLYIIGSEVLAFLLDKEDKRRSMAK